MLDFNFVGIDGKVYHLAPVTIGQQAELRQWVRFAPYFEFVKSNEGLPEDFVKEHTAALLRECAEKELADEDIENALSTPAGIIRLCYLSCKRADRDITQEQIENALSMSMLGDIVSKIAIASGWTTAEALSKKKELMTVETFTENSATLMDTPKPT